MTGPARRGSPIALLLTLLCGAATIAAPKLNHASRRVAFMGDSLTQGWSFPRTNFGIFGQTTGQMLARFPAQVGTGAFREVVICGGTNDTLLGLPPEQTTANLSRMIDLARADGVRPVLARIPPIYRDDGRFLPAVRALDQRIDALAREKRVPLADYYGALSQHPDAFSDGVHLKRRGYLRMEWALLHADRPF